MTLAKWFNVGKKKPKDSTSVHQRVKAYVLRHIEINGCLGCTTGVLMKTLENTPLGARIEQRAPEGQRVQYFKTVIGHALDDLQAEGAVHCDEIGKRIMQGDDRSVPVWRTVHNYELLGVYCRWLLQDARKDGGPQYAFRQRKHLSNFKTQFEKDTA